MENKKKRAKEREREKKKEKKKKGGGGGGKKEKKKEKKRGNESKTGCVGYKMRNIASSFSFLWRLFCAWRFPYFIFLN